MSSSQYSVVVILVVVAAKAIIVVVFNDYQNEVFNMIKETICKPGSISQSSLCDVMLAVT